MRYTWDPAKAEINLKKHGVSFEEAATVFADPSALYAADRDHDHEERMRVIGNSSAGRVLFVVGCEVVADEEIRIISARRATASERKAYEEGS